MRPIRVVALNDHQVALIYSLVLADSPGARPAAAVVLHEFCRGRDRGAAHGSRAAHITLLRWLAQSTANAKPDATRRQHLSATVVMTTTVAPVNDADGPAPIP
jgi:hypothetical protein